MTDEEKAKEKNEKEKERNEKEKEKDGQVREMDGKAREKAGKAKKRLLDGEVPPADFFTILATFQLPAMQFLGEVRDPTSEKIEVHPSLAKYYIDCLAVLDEKTRGNLQDEEKKALDNVLTQLRLLYVKNAPGGQKEGS